MSKDLEKTLVGYARKDVMRDKAEALMRDELKANDKRDALISFSAPARTKVRLYKKGGKV